MDEWDLTSTSMHRISQKKYEVAVLPTGAIEPHNRHLPEGQDFLHTTHVARRSCELAWQKSPSIVCLPTIPYGVDCNLFAYPLAISLRQTTLDLIATDIIQSLLQHNIHKIVIINGHGGNDFKPWIRQIQCDLDVYVFQCNWWLVGKDRYNEIFAMPDDHAGEFETSVALQLYPEQVESLEVAGDGQARPFRFEALDKGWVNTSRDFSKLNDHCAVGNPKAATAEKGKKYLDLVCQRISEFLAELAASSIDQDFPYK